MSVRYVNILYILYEWIFVLNTFYTVTTNNKTSLVDLKLKY